MVPNWDLNYSPDSHKGTPDSANELASEGDSGSEHVALPPSNLGLSSSPIDVESIEEEVEVLSPSRGVPQTRSRTGRSQPTTVILDDDLETNLRQPDVSTEEPVTTLSLGAYGQHETVPSNKILIDCDEDDSSKGKSVMETDTGPIRLVLEEPSFTCPVCKNKLVAASSTICGHIFCESCITASIKTQKKCPTCRRKLRKNSVHRVYLPLTD
ncbi:uncharacterized protein [Typha latifolia]|uniref:uncharacterized protein isoform X2 n=1 Tax=Typha latifolia TaxID=4733 RepID=UPI003C2D3C40